MDDNQVVYNTGHEESDNNSDEDIVMDDKEKFSRLKTATMKRKEKTVVMRAMMKSWNIGMWLIFFILIFFISN